MHKFRSLLKTSILGGVTVILPLAIFAIVFRWIFRILTDVIQPGTNIVMSRSPLPEPVADAIVVAIILIACFTVGMIVKTKFGGVFFGAVDKALLKLPLYSLIKETVIQFMGANNTFFSAVALVRLTAQGPYMTGFLMDRHPSGLVTVFLPTGPNPTSGNIVHLPESHVHRLTVSVEDAMRSIISCGTGSQSLFETLPQTERAMLVSRLEAGAAKPESMEF
ncbi:MAG: DUF502 domain-containing protein [Desulfatibacillaceae bacterium]